MVLLDFHIGNPNLLLYRHGGFGHATIVARFLGEKLLYPVIQVLCVVVTGALLASSEGSLQPLLAGIFPVLCWSSTNYLFVGSVFCMLVLW